MNRLEKDRAVFLKAACASTDPLIRGFAEKMQHEQCVLTSPRLRYRLMRLKQRAASRVFHILYKHGWPVFLRWAEKRVGKEKVSEFLERCCTVDTRDHNSWGRMEDGRWVPPRVEERIQNLQKLEL